ncbi:hypothetical protein Hanom_Chr04g00302791 [Helianthus anomalus]
MFSLALIVVLCHPSMFGLVWFGLVRFGSVWFGSVWFGLVWFGLWRWNNGCAPHSPSHRCMD